MKVLLLAASLVLIAQACNPEASSKALSDLATCTQGAMNDKGKMCSCSQSFLDTFRSAIEGCDAATTASSKAMIDQTEQELKKECGTCFPASAMVELANGKFKSMDQLVIGDKVRVSDNEFSEVYYFSTNLPETTSKFVKITTEETQLHLTATHYLYVNGELLEARAVKVGDVVILGNGSKTSVTEVSSSWLSGLYNPHTMHGDVVVDGVRTSTYTEAVHPKLAHILLSPLRAMYTAGVTFGQGFNAFSKNMPQWVLEAISA